MQRDKEIFVFDQNANRSERSNFPSTESNSNVYSKQPQDFEDAEVIPSVEDRKGEVNLFSELNRTTGMGIGHLNSTLIFKHQGLAT